MASLNLAEEGLAMREQKKEVAIIDAGKCLKIMASFRKSVHEPTDAQMKALS